MQSRRKKVWDRNFPNSGSSFAETAGAGKWEKKMKTAAGIAFWLALWQILTLFLHNSILLSGPLEVFGYLKDHILTVSFWKTVGNSFFHIFSGFFLAFCTGLFLGCFSAGHRFLETLLSPFLQFIKAVPVASFVVLLLIFMGSGGLSAAVAFLMVLPIVYQNVLEGIRNTDPALLEMAKVYRMSLHDRIFFIYRPSLMPFLVSSSKVALGMSFKAGVAAEVIGTPDFSIGERVYMSKIYLDTAGLFAWTFVVILLSFCFERMFLKLLLLFGERKIRVRPAKNVPGKETGKDISGDIIIEELAKGYGRKEVFAHLSNTFRGGEISAVMGDSGCGKTTLFRILLGLDGYDGGRLVLPKGRCGAVFQEDRLCLNETPVVNVCMAAGGGRTETEIAECLSQILPEECLRQETRQLSGGMKRRTAVARALLSESEWILLDEPFTGLDGETKKRTADFILKYRNGRTLVFSTHSKEEAGLLSAEVTPFGVIRMENSR